MTTAKLSVACQSCGAILRYGLPKAGKIVNCPSCSRSVILDGAEVSDVQDEILDELRQFRKEMRSVRDNLGCLLHFFVIVAVLSAIITFFLGAPR